jgi:hypothetical protein
LKEISSKRVLAGYNFTLEPITNKMKTLILATCLFTSILMQGCYAYVEPAGGYYERDGFWWYHDGRGREFRDNHRWHERYAREHPEHHEDHDHH